MDVVFKFRSCLLSLPERKVVRDNEFLDLTSKAFDVLLLLIQRRGTIVTKDDILGEIWNGSFVEENNLAVHISRLRRTLDENRHNAYIETVQGQGYRFVAPVESITVEDWERAVANIEKPKEPKNRQWQYGSIAVMPLMNVCRDTEIDYLADGLTEGFINMLSRFSDLRVLGKNTSFRYRHKKFDPTQIGETFGVSAVMTGRIRLNNNILDIGVELTRTSDGTQIWGTKVHRQFQELLTIEDSIINEVLDKLRSEIVRAVRNPIGHNITSNFESYRLYLKGQHFLEKGTKAALNRALSCFESSVNCDSSNLHSYIGIIETHFQLYFADYISYEELHERCHPLFHLATTMTQEIDVMQAMIGGRRMYLDWAFKEAEDHFRRALFFNPECMIARYRLANFLLMMGEDYESMELLQQIRTSDPLSFIAMVRVARTLYKMERYNNAIFIIDELLDLDPNNHIGLLLKAACLVEMGEPAEAIELASVSLDSEFNVETLSHLGYIHAKNGDRMKAMEIVNQLNELEVDSAISGMKVGKILLALGDRESALNSLHDALAKHDVDLISLNRHPAWKECRNEPGFEELLKKVGLPS